MAQTVEKESIFGLWVRPSTTGPALSGSQVTQIDNGAFRMPSSFRLL